MGNCDPLYAPGTHEFYRALISTAICVLGAALAAGLTMGLIALNEMELLILLETKEEECETEEEKLALRVNKSHAERVLPLVQEHHLLLVTLLLLNCVANESLPLFLDSLVPSWIAIMLSVSLILMFGEILPSALFTGAQGLKFSAYLSPMVYCAMFILFPLAYPISLMLDRSLPHALTKYTKAEVLALLRLHVEEDNDDAASTNVLGLRENEVRIIKGALGLRKTRVRDVLTPRNSTGVFMVSEDAVLDSALLAEIVRQGHSRIPVYGGNNVNDIRGLLLTKKLTSISPEEKRKIKSMFLREPTFVNLDDSLAHTLSLLRANKQHLAIVTNAPQELAQRFRNGTFNHDLANMPAPQVEIYGVVTLLDVIENLVDEVLEENEDDGYDDDEPMVRDLTATTATIISTPIGISSGATLGRWAKMRRMGSARLSSSSPPSDLRTALLLGDYGSSGGEQE